MFPMIATVKEFKDAKAIFEEEKAKLVKEGIPVSDDIEVGMMMEIPAAAMMIEVALIENSSRPKPSNNGTAT